MRDPDMDYAEDDAEVDRILNEMLAEKREHRERLQRNLILLEVPNEDDVFPEWDAAAELADDARRGK